MKRIYKAWIVIGAMAVVVAVAVVWKIAGTVASKPKVEPHPVQGRPPVVVPVPEELARRGWVYKGVSNGPSRMLTAAESNEVAAVLSGILEAYTNGQAEVMRERMGHVPSWLPEVCRDEYRDLMAPLSWYAHKFCKFWDPDPFDDFGSVRELDAYLDLNRSMMHFVGDLDIRRGPLSGFSVSIEAGFLMLLQGYRSHFQGQNKDEFVKCVDRYINEWIEFIESENGYTRRYAWCEVSLQYVNYNEGNWTCGQLFRWARSYAAGLVRASHYRPKWLDEDFPLPEGMKDVWEH